MKIQFNCACGNMDHEEKMIDGRKMIICDVCGEKYFTGSALREERERTEKEQAAGMESR